MTQFTSAQDTEAHAIPCQFGNVSSSYTPYQKHVRSGIDLVLHDAYLKWYDISLEEIDLAVLAEERWAFLTSASHDGRLTLEDDLVVCQ